MKTFWALTGLWLISIGVAGFWHNPWTLTLGFASSIAFGGYTLYMGR